MDLAGKYFLLQVSRFAACLISSSIHPPPYFLHGKFCRCSFRSDASFVQVSPSWQLCHQFEYAQLENATAPQMVLECYSGVEGDDFIGMCRVELQHFLEASTSSPVDPVVTLQLRDGDCMRGDVSFHVKLEELLPVTLQISRVAITPNPSPGNSLYLELFCSFDGSAGVACVRSEFASHGTAEWEAQALLRCRVSLSALERDGVAMGLLSHTGERIGCCRIPLRSLTSVAMVAEASGRRFDFDELVVLAGHCGTSRCVGCLILSVGAPVVMSSCTEETKEVVMDGEWTRSACMNLPEDVRVLRAVVEQQQAMLGTVRERLACVHDEKESVQEQLKALNEEVPSGRSKVLRAKCEMETKLHASLEQRRLLTLELAALQQRRDMVARDHAIQVQGGTQSLQELEAERSRTSCLYESVEKLQEEMKADTNLEAVRRQERLLFAEEQQRLARDDAEALAKIMRL